MSKLKNITIRLPKESPAYETIAKCVAEEGNSWSGVALRFLTASVENVVTAKKHAATIKRQIHTIKDLTNKQREWAVEEDRVSSEINKNALLIETSGSALSYISRIISCPDKIDIYNVHRKYLKQLKFKRIIIYYIYLKILIN